MNAVIDIESKKRNLLGLPIHDLKFTELMHLLSELIKDNKKAIVYGFSGGIFPRLKNMPEFVEFFSKSDIVVSDGAGTLILAKIFGIKIRERIGIPNLALKLIEYANENHLGVFLLGATKEINAKACDQVKNEYKNIRSCDGRNGYFNPGDELSIINEINKSKAEILLIGITSPIKERFAIKYKKQLSANIIVPCGGVIDVLSGTIKRPPKIVRSLPITWLYRFIQEPKRLYSTTIKLVFELIFQLLPILYFKHITGIKKNPSIIDHYKLKLIFRDPIEKA